jgi:two-component system cell cycle response regulator DivK
MAAVASHRDALPTSGAVVLLVESHDDSRDMYADDLRTCGFTVQTAKTTDDGLICAGEADVIVTGICVPGSFDGVELVRRLRKSDKTKTTPIIVVTACAFEPYKQRAHAAGCSAFLPKPCLPERLVDEIQAVLTHTPKPRQPGGHGNHRTGPAS